MIATSDSSVIPIDIGTDARTRAQIYTLDMLMHKMGYPLYKPTPLRILPTVHRMHGVRVGDVGVITEEGAFHFMFNACQGHDQPDPAANSAELLDRFELLQVSPESDIEVKRLFGPRTLLPSNHINEIRCDMDVSESWMSRHLRCHETELGAALALPKGATLYKAMNKLQFQKHAARHAINWYKYMLDKGRDISNGSLYFVTQCVKSINWGTVVFYGHPIASDHLRLIFSRDSCQWDYCGKVDAREGPELTDIISSDKEPNQCVFLGGYKVMLRQDIWNELLKNAIGIVSSQDGEPTSTGTSDHSTSPSMSGSQTKPFHPSMSDGYSARDPSSSTIHHASQAMHRYASNTVRQPKRLICPVTLKMRVIQNMGGPEKSCWKSLLVQQLLCVLVYFYTFHIVKLIIF